MKEIKSIIYIRRKLLHLSLGDIARELSVARSTVCRWESGDIRKISDDKIKKLAKLLNTSEDRIRGNKNSTMKPILGIVKAGYDMYGEENIIGYEEVVSEDQSRGDYFLQVQGDSMINHRIHDGDLVYVKSCQDVDNNQIAIVLMNGSEATVKKVIKKDHTLILEAGNPAYENRIFSEQEIKELPIQIIGKVIYTKVVFNDKN